MPKQHISRVLCTVQRSAVIHLALSTWSGSCGLTRSAIPQRGIRRGPSQGGTYLALLQAGFSELPRSPGTLVSSYLPDTSAYRTPSLRAPFHPFPGLPGWFPFLWHFPSPSWGRLIIMERLALRSSDFPLPHTMRVAERLPVLLRQLIRKLNYYIIFSRLS